MHRQRRPDVCTAALAFAVLASQAVATPARAGGFELPDNGTQSLGRGAAFVAKADDGTAIQYNPAGLARQRGTRLLANGNLYLHSYEFQRSGNFIDDPNDTATPWGGRPYPVVRNESSAFFAPFAAVSSDFGYFDRFTFAAGAYGPPTVGNRTFPLGVENQPASSRYDYVQSRSTLIYPTASAAFRATPWLDVGVSGHLVLGNFDQTTVSFNDFGSEICPNAEYQPCDSKSTLNATATSAAATIGALARPTENLGFGLSVRTPININASGTVTPEPPRAASDLELQPGDATLSLQLPWVVRAGGRYISMAGNFEVYDLELDFIYEAWGVSQATGPIVRIPDLGAVKDVETVVQHGYKNTFGLRGGGAYNIDTGDGILSVRAGAYFDSSATDFANTRLDFDTLAKVAGTLGLGFKIGAFGLDAGYAAVASIPRVVGDGQGAIRPINPQKGGQPIDAENNLLPPINEGAYRGFTHILSVGVSVTFDELFGPLRPIRYGNAYEPGYEPEGSEAKSEDKKRDEEKKPEETPDEKKPEEKKPEEKKPEEKKPEEKKPDDAKKKGDKKDDKPPSKKKEWWEELD